MLIEVGYQNLCVRVISRQSGTWEGETKGYMEFRHGNTMMYRHRSGNQEELGVLSRGLAPPSRANAIASPRPRQI